MEWLRLSGLSVGSLTTVILLGLVVLYLLSLKDKQPDTWYLIGYMGSLWTLIAAYTLRYSVYHPADVWFGQIANLVVFGGVALIQFAYHYQGRLGRREPQVALVVSLVASAVVWTGDFLTAGLPGVPFVRSLLDVLGYGVGVSLVALLAHVWALIVLLRKSRKLSRSSRPANAVSVARSVRATRYLAVLFGSTAAVAATHLLFRAGVISRTSYVTMFNIGSLLVGLLILVVYINSSTRPVSFLLKLVSVSLATVLVSLGLAATAMAPVVQQTISEYYAAKAERAAVLVSGAVSGYSVDESVGFVVDSNGEVLYSVQDVPAAVLWRAISGFRQENAASDDWGDRLTMLEQYDADAPYLVRSTEVSGELYRVGISYAAYRLVAHGFWIRLALVVLATSGVILIMFPVFFGRSLLLPITRLMAAVEQVSAGDYGEPVPVLSEDETGRLSRAYNEMINSLRHAEAVVRDQQQQIMQADKLASIGELVAGVAHEIHNPNQVIALRAHIISEGLRDLFELVDDAGGVEPALRIGGLQYPEFRDSALQGVEEIRQSTQRINKIVGELKGYVRSGEVAEVATTDVNEAVGTVINMCSHLIRGATDNFNLELSSEVLVATIGKTELEQVVLNLIQNACHSLPDRQSAITVTTARSGEKVAITVADGGTGMPEETLAQVFDPFFTTKRESGGTGLGLSVSRRLVKQAGGELHLSSSLGAGTVASIQLQSG